VYPRREPWGLSVRNEGSSGRAELELVEQMFIFGNLIGAVAGVLDIVLSIYMWIVIIAALITWVNPDPYNPVVRFLSSVTEPVFSFVRRTLPIPAMGIDFTPIIVLLAIVFLQQFLVKTLQQIAANLH
jgi:YggT family protein